MITGISNFTGDTTEKYLEYLTTIMPDLKRVGFLADFHQPVTRDIP